MFWEIYSYSTPLKQMHWSLYLLYSSHFDKRLLAASSSGELAMSHLARVLVTTVWSFGPFLSSLLLPSSSGKPSNSSTHS